MDISALDVEKDNEIAPIWQSFVKQHLTAKHFYDLCELFDTQLKDHYPLLHTKIRQKNLKIGQVHVDTFDDCDVLLNANIAVNTPVYDKSTRVRGPHIDVNNQLFAGLLYFRDENDHSNGGDFTIYSASKTLRFSNNEAFDEDVHSRVQAKYGQNNLVVFLNSARSIHGVTPREITSFERKFFIFSVYVKEALFDLSKQQ